MNGLIIKAISGFYYVMCDDTLFECRARGIFRHNGSSDSSLAPEKARGDNDAVTTPQTANCGPLVGDTVEIEPLPDNKGTVCRIFDRKNSFLRPPIANLDRLFIIASTCQPNPNILLIDKLIAVCEYKDIEPIIVITKTDLLHDRELQKTYTDAGFKTLYLSNNEEIDICGIKAELCGKISAFTGNTGVGKSSLINNLFPELMLETAHISKKLGRGRHTTRQVELFAVDSGGYVADTPGFGSMDMVKYDVIYKDKLELCFREFSPYLNKCQFTGCSHTTEKGCAILSAVNNGAISPIRHANYVTMYNEAKLLNAWEV